MCKRQGSGGGTGELAGAVWGVSAVEGDKCVCGEGAGWCWGVSAGAGPCMKQAPRLGACPLLVMAVGRSPPWPGLWGPSQVSFHRQWFCEPIIFSSWGADA